MTSSNNNGSPSKFFFSMPVWGENHINLFLSIGLPSLLAPGNLPALRLPARFLIYTRVEDEPRLRNAESIRALERLMPIEYHQITTPNRYLTAPICHLHTLHRADREEAAALFPPPDCIWANGSFRRVEEIAAAGNNVIFIPGLRVDLDHFGKTLGVSSPGRLPLIVPTRQLVNLALGNLHPIALSHCWDGPSGGLMPANIYWRVAREGILAHCFHLHPLLVRAEVKFASCAGTIDDDLVLAACPDASKHHIVQDSDEVLCFEISPAAHHVGLPCRERSIEDVVLWAARSTNQLHRQLIKVPLRILSQRPTEARWRETENHASQVIAHILKRFESSYLQSSSPRVVED